ncbi:hypothetical protein MMC25_006886 [Agyrium rufum]|nr:hypothetical protein [Agyrium rufum]
MADNRSRGGSGRSQDANSPLDRFPDLPGTDGASSSPPGTAAHASRGRLRTASLKFMESNPPLGFLNATGEAAAKAPSLAEIRRGSFGSNGWNAEIQRRESDLSNASSSRRNSRTNSLQPTVTSPSTSKPAANALTSTDEIEEVDDGFPAMVFGRGRLDNQSFSRAEKKPTKEKDITPDEEDLASDMEDDEFRSRPKRSSNAKLKAMLGDSPTRNDAFARTQTSSPPPSFTEAGPNEDGVYPNGYKFPPKHTWGEATVIGLRAMWRFTLTPLGFAVVVYGLNVVAWGGMLFLLLCGAAPAMCYPAALHGVKDCNNIGAPRRIWIETTSQILNSLFCVTGFGLAPWRFRDLYYLLRWRIQKKHSALRILAGYNRSWFRLAGSEKLPMKKVMMDGKSGEVELVYRDGKYDMSLPLPLSASPDPPLTGMRAPPTAPWKLDYVIWAFVWNTLLQVVLSFFMWHYNRYTRPSWSTGLFVAMACIIAGMGGFMGFQEGKKVKKVEGVPVSVEEMVRDIERDNEKKDFARDGKAMEKVSSSVRVQEKARASNDSDAQAYRSGKIDEAGALPENVNEASGLGNAGTDKQPCT